MEDDRVIEAWPYPPNPPPKPAPCDFYGNVPADELPAWKGKRFEHIEGAPLGFVVVESVGADPEWAPYDVVIRWTEVTGRATDDDRDSHAYATRFLLSSRHWRPVATSSTDECACCLVNRWTAEQRAKLHEIEHVGALNGDDDADPA